MRFRWAILVSVAVCLLAVVPSQAAAQAGSHVLLLEVSGPLTPAMAEYLDRGLAQAERDSAEAVIFQLDTPGGSVDLMNRMVRSIRGSQVPVVVYVAPRGAIAGSAGTVITVAGHVAAMAPETAIGAASPVGAQGEDLGETIEAKAKQMLKATIRSLASWRGEEAVALAEATIDAATAASAQEALEVGLIDLIAEDVDSLLQQLDGMRIDTADGFHRLETDGLEIRELPQSAIEKLLQALTNPNIVFILLTVGVQAVLIELSSPGGWVAGFIGVVCLALGAYGLGVLPVNWIGMIFMVTAFVLFLLEVKAPTHGALTAAGLVSFILGALVLFNSPSTPSFQRVSIPLVLGASVVTAGLFLVIVTYAIRAQRRPIAVGAEALVGQIGVARTKLNPGGMVHVAGELWSAEIESGAEKVKSGGRVKVTSVDGLRLRVRPDENASG
ncbi:MAG: nodulation protein NfeD [Anaerolineales bacterium]